MRGGKREGAGRPAIDQKEKRVQVSISVSPNTKRKISAMRKDGIQVNAYIEQLVDDLCYKWELGQDL